MGKELDQLEGYLRSLEALVNLFARGLPPKETLAHALDKEERLRSIARRYDWMERANLAYECGLETGLFVDHAVDLARHGRPKDAARLTALLDFLFEDEAGIPQEIVRALTGNVEAARENLVALAKDAQRLPLARRNAVVALERIGDLEGHVDCTFQLVREFAGRHDFRNACDAAYELAETLRSLDEEGQAAWGRPEGGPTVLN